MANCYELPEPGDHISVPSMSSGPKKTKGYGLYRHHMLVTRAQDIGNVYEVFVIENNKLHPNEPSTLKRLFPGKFRKHSYHCLYSGPEAIRRARSKIGDKKSKYSLLDYNCEHFVTWAKTGSAESEQVWNKYGTLL